jgi:hypothetical protein
VSGGRVEVPVHLLDIFSVVSCRSARAHLGNV